MWITFSKVLERAKTPQALAAEASPNQGEAFGNPKSEAEQSH